MKQHDELYILMNRALDGELTEEERKEFEQTLEHNPEAKKEYEELKKTFHLLEKDAAALDEADFAGRIIENLDPSLYNPQPKKSFLEALGLSNIGGFFKYGFGFALGLAVGFFVLNAFQPGVQNGIPAQKVYGTMAEISATEALADIDSYEFTARDGSISITTKLADTVSIAEISFATNAQNTVTIGFDQSAISLAGLKSVTAPPAGFAASDEGEIMITAGGRETYLLYLKLQRGAASPLSVTVSVADSVISRRTLQVKPD